MDSSQKFIEDKKMKIGKVNMDDVSILSGLIKEHFGIDVSLPTRQRDVVNSRMVFYKILRDMGNTWMSIARVHNKDHSTIIHAVNTFDDLVTIEPPLREQYILVKELFYAYKGDAMLAVKSRNDLIQTTLALEKENDIYKKDMAILRAKLEVRENFEPILKKLSDNAVTKEELDSIDKSINHLLNNRHETQNFPHRYRAL